MEEAGQLSILCKTGGRTPPKCSAVAGDSWGNKCKACLLFLPFEIRRFFPFAADIRY